MKNTLPDNLPVSLRILFKTYAKLRPKHFSFKFQFSSHLVTEISNKFQYLSIVILLDPSIAGYQDLSAFTNFFKLFRIDHIFIELNFQGSFHLLILSTLCINILTKFLIGFQIQYKKKYLRYQLALLSRISTWVIDTILFIPFTVYTIVYLHGSLDPEGYKKEYSDNFQVTPYLIFGLFPMLMTFYVLKIFDLFFGNFPKYSVLSVCRMHSVVEFRVLISTLLIGILRAAFNAKYCLHLYFVVAGVNWYSYLYFLPYCNLGLNMFAVHTWGSVAVCCALCRVSQILDNFFLVELNFIVLFVVLALFLNSFVKKRLDLVNDCCNSKNPYVHELKIRKFLVYEQHGSDVKDYIFKHYKFANKYFRNFCFQYIWESLTISKFLKDKELALLKLVKINTAKIPKKTFLLDVRSLTFTYIYFPETEFLLYFKFKSIIKQLRNLNDNRIQIKYCNYFKKAKNIDQEIITELLDFIQVISGTGTIKSIESRIKQIGTQIKSYKELSKTLNNKFGIDKKFVRLYATFLQDVMNSKKGTELLTYYGITDNLGVPLIQESSEFEINEPLLIISGWHENIGTILYANSPMYNLLKINMENKLIGTNFVRLIPEPFDKMHEKVLSRFLFERNSCNLIRDHLFLIDSQNYCIEVTMQFKIAFYRGYPYFVATFKKFNKLDKNFILCNPNGDIISYSCNVKCYISDLGSNIYSSIPEIQNYEFDEIFEFKYEQRLLHMKKNSLSIDGYTLNILNFIDDSALLSKKSSMVINDMQKNVRISEFFGDEDKKMSTIKEKEFIKGDTKETQEHKSNNDLNLKGVLKIISCMKITIWLLIFLEIVVTIAVIFVIIEIIQSISVNQIIFDIGLMRYLSCSILSNTFSLDLLNRNFTVLFNESFYRLALADNSNKLKGFIEQYEEITLPFLNEKKHYFSNSHLEIHNYYNDSITTKEVSLMNAMQTMVSYSSLIANTSLSNFAEIYNEKMFIYSNVPAKYTYALNETVMDVMYDLIASLRKTYKYLGYIELLCIFPPILIILVCSICFFIIEKKNRSFWRSLFNHGNRNQIEIRGNLINRLYFYHEQEYFYDDSNRGKNKVHYTPITLKPFLKLLILFFLSLGFYFSVTFGPQYLLEEMMVKELVHTNFGGLRRMMTPLTLFWGRNSILYSTSDFFYEKIVKNYEISSSPQEMRRRVNQLNSIQYELMMNLRGPIESHFGFDEYKKLMFGQACDIIDTIVNCSNTIASYGLDSALKFYLNELKIQNDIYEDIGYRPNMLVSIEKYSKVVEKAFVFGLFVYANYTDKVVNELKNQLGWTSGLFLFVMVVYYVLFLHGIANRILNDLEEKEEILQVFCKNEKKNKNVEKGATIGDHLDLRKTIDFI